MSLPILQSARARSREDRIRLFMATELQWTQHVANQMDLSAGSTFSNPALSRLPAANRVLTTASATELPNSDVEPLLAEVDRHFAEQASRCLQWIFPGASTTDSQRVLRNELVRLGYVESARPIFALAIAPATVRLPEVSQLSIIPARASYRHAQLLADVMAGETHEPQRSLERMLHLDDPHCEGLLALRDGRVLGGVDVLTVGDVGRIDGLYVDPVARQQGIGRTLLNRAVEICARAALREVMLAWLGEGAAPWLSSAGFEVIGQMQVLQRT